MLYKELKIIIDRLKKYRYNNRARLIAFDKNKEKLKMKIIALEFYKNGFMKEALAFGGSIAKESLDLTKNYEASLQNYLIDTGKEVILVDTGLPVETKDVEPKPE